ncbi:MAG: sigma-70 family RNA polymerase sigma factor [Rubrobacter sp.]
MILACRAGDRGAWRRLLDRYERLVYSIPLRYGLPREDAADVAQLTFTALIRALDGLPEDSRLGGWLATVAKRHTWRLLERKRRVTPVAGEHLEGADLAETAVSLGRGDAESIEHWELADDLDSGLSKLGSPCRELLVTLYFEPESPSYVEISETLNMPVGSIGPTRARCLKRLRRLLEGG